MSLISTIFKYGFWLYLVLSYKSLPGAYFVRFYYYAIKNIITPKVINHEENKKLQSRLQSETYGAMSQTKLSTYVSPMECDLYFHKNNATYFEELDVSRCDLMCKIFNKLFTDNGDKSWPYIPVANVFTNYLKELKPFEKYNVYSSILCWDKKWIYVVSRFTKCNDKILCSLSMTKYVLKDGRKTIPPQDALKQCGMWNEQVEALSQENLTILTTKCGFHETTPLEEMDFSKFPTI